MLQLELQSEINTEESEMATDSCQQVQFIDVLVGVDPMKVRFVLSWAA